MPEQYLIRCDTQREAANVMLKFAKVMDLSNELDKAYRNRCIVILKDGSSYRFVGEACYRNAVLGFRGKVISGWLFEDMLDKFVKEKGIDIL